LQYALENSNDGLWDWHIETNTVYFNARWQLMLGYAADELEPHLSTWQKLLHPDDSTHVMAILMDHLQAKSQNYEAEFRLKRKDGEWCWILSRGRIVERDKQGKPMRVIGTHVDITERKQEALLLNKLHAISVDFATDKRHILDQVAALAGDFLDFDEYFIIKEQAGNEETLSTNTQLDWSSYVQLFPVVREYYAPAKNQPQPLFLNSIAIDNAKTRAALLFIPIRGGAITHEYLAMAIFIAHRAKPETYVKQRQRFLEIIAQSLHYEMSRRDYFAWQYQLEQERKMDAIGQLVAGVAHEINTPIQFVGDNLAFVEMAHKAFSQFMHQHHQTINTLNINNSADIRAWRAQWQQEWRQQDMDFYLEELPQAFEHARQGVERVSTVVKAMKSFSKTGDQHSKQAVNINHEIENILIVCHEEWKNVATINTQYDTRLESVMCSPIAINQVILSMVVNAAHAIAEKSANNPMHQGLIQISTQQIQDLVCIRIADNGSGMDEKIRLRIFDPFFTTKEMGKGAGQGLAVAHNIIVKDHGGRIDVVSAVGEGSTFTLWLSLKGKPCSAAIPTERLIL
jgi:two-component system, NtrC family, sensor kinase